MKNRVRYKCNACGFKFTRKNTVQFSQCPYCGKEKTFVEDKQNTAESLLRESLD